MAKTRAQRKAERRRREQQLQRQGQHGQGTSAPPGGERAVSEQEPRAQQETQLGVSGEVREAEAAIETGQAPEDLRVPEPPAPPEAAPPAPETSVPEAPPATEALAPSRADVGRPEPEAPPVPEPRESRRARREREKEERRRARAREQQRGQAERAERRRGPVLGFFASCWAELKRVQWPDRDTLVQASAVTVIFVAVCAAYLGALDALFNFLVKQIL